MATPGVVSVSLGKDQDGHMAIIVGLGRARPDIEDQLPRTWKITLLLFRLWDR
jgi:hypothetical protein